MLGIISSSITTNLIPLMDSLAVISALLCAILILFSKVEEFTTEKYYALYAAVWFFALSVPISIGIAWIPGGKV